jgi:hypothetical protein
MRVRFFCENFIATFNLCYGMIHYHLQPVIPGNDPESTFDSYPFVYWYPFVY